MTLLGSKTPSWHGVRDDLEAGLASISKFSLTLSHSVAPRAGESNRRYYIVPARVRLGVIERFSIYPWIYPYEDQFPAFLRHQSAPGGLLAMSLQYPM